MLSSVREIIEFVSSGKMRSGKCVYKIIAARPAAMAPRPMALDPAAFVTRTGPDVVGLGPVLKLVVSRVAGVVAGGAGVEMAY